MEPSAAGRIAGSGASHTNGRTWLYVLEGKLLVLSQGRGSLTGALLRSMLCSTNWFRLRSCRSHPPASWVTSSHCTALK